MARNFSDIAFTPSVRAFQERMGSRHQYAPLDHGERQGHVLSEREIAFIQERDGFYQATVGEDGWPYVQFRGGPAGFVRVLDDSTLGYADFRGNVQYISAGNLQGNDRIALILMDYANRRRLKIWGRARLVDVRDDESLVGRLEVPTYRARVERAVLISVEAFDWNCPQHITPRFTADEFAAASRLADAQGRPADATPATRRSTDTRRELGKGPIAVAVTGMHQLTPRIRAYTLRAVAGGELPAAGPGAHLALPLPGDSTAGQTRHYSIASDPACRHEWQVAIQASPQGTGGAAQIHAHYEIGTHLNIDPPVNAFPLHDDDRPAILIAGGIGITPLRAMAFALKASGRSFEIHYSTRSRDDMAWSDNLADAFGATLTRYVSDEGARMDLAKIIGQSPPHALVYACGPTRLLDEAVNVADRLGASDRLKVERFTPPRRSDDKALRVELRRSGILVDVVPEQSILEAVETAGVAVPFSCRTGTCGRCATKVLAGQPDHRDSALSPAEREMAGLMCLCVSRSQSSSLVLDI